MVVSRCAVGDFKCNRPTHLAQVMPPPTTQHGRKARCEGDDQRSRPCQNVVPKQDGLAPHANFRPLTNNEERPVLARAQCCAQQGFETSYHSDRTVRSVKTHQNISCTVISLSSALDPKKKNRSCRRYRERIRRIRRKL